MIHLKNKCNFATRKTKSHTHESVYTCFYQPFHSGFGVIPRTGQEKRAMTFDEMVSWERISEQQISNDGKWVYCKMEPWRGDATVFLYNEKGEEAGRFKPASKGQFSASSHYLLVTQTPPLAVVEAEKLKKTAKEKMPMNSLAIVKLTNGRQSNQETIDSLKSYKLSETADWLAYQRGNKNDSTLYIRSLDGTVRYSFPAVTDSGLPERGMCSTSCPILPYIPIRREKGMRSFQRRKGFSNKSHSTKPARNWLISTVPTKIQPPPKAVFSCQKTTGRDVCLPNVATRLSRPHG